MSPVADGEASQHDGIDDPAPLAGVRVVEMSMYVQGPVCGLTLASLGADVVKIEQVGQEDVMRGFSSLFGVTLDDRGKEWIYASLNRNKRSLALDVTSEAGRPVFERLIEQADVFISNMRESALAKHGADPETLHRINPRLVYARGAGFGIRGPLADDPCQDTVGMAYGGFMDATANGDTPNYPPGSMSDVLTGTTMASGVMAGLVKRGITGKGCVVGTSQVQSLLWLQLQGVGLAATTGQRMERFAPDATTNPLFTVYPTSNGWLAIACLRADHWRALAAAVGLDWMLEDARFARFGDLIRNRDEFRPLFTEHLSTNTTDHWWQLLRQAGIWSSPVRRLEELATDEHVLANEYLVTYDDGFVGPPAPFEIDGFRGARGLAAEYSEHTDEILAELGYSEDEIVMLRADSAIW